MKILLDTCVLIDDPDLTAPGALYFASSLSRAELVAGVAGASNERDRESRADRLAELDTDFDWLPFTAHAADTYGFLASELRRVGKNALSRRIDTFLAAHALSIDAAFMTSNRKDFQYLQEAALLAVVFV